MEDLRELAESTFGVLAKINETHAKLRWKEREKEIFVVVALKNDLVFDRWISILEERLEAEAVGRQRSTGTRWWGDASIAIDSAVWRSDNTSSRQMLHPAQTNWVCSCFNVEPRRLRLKTHYPFPQGPEFYRLVRFAPSLLPRVLTATSSDSNPHYGTTCASLFQSLHRALRSCVLNPTILAHGVSGDCSIDHPMPRTFLSSLASTRGRNFSLRKF